MQKAAANKILLLTPTAKTRRWVRVFVAKYAYDQIITKIFLAVNGYREKIFAHLAERCASCRGEKSYKLASKM